MIKTPFNIGRSTVTFDENGEITEASFKPNVEIKADAPLLDTFRKLSGSDDPDSIKTQSEILMSKWFNATSEALDWLENADRDVYEITGEVVTCEKYNNGKVKTCIIQYTCKEIAHA